MTADQLQAKYSDVEFRSRYLALYSLKNLFSSAIYTDRFVVPKAILKAVQLTAYGKEAEQKIREAAPELDDERVRYLAFLLFGHEELLVDLTSTSVDAVAAALCPVVSAGGVTYPWLFDHLLYDRATSLGSVSDRPLSPAETNQILQGTPVGVFQLDAFVVGPLGLIKATQARFVPPKLNVVIGHCSDPTCRELHRADCVDLDSAIARELASAKERLEEDGEEAAWEEFYIQLAQLPEQYYDDFSTRNLPLFLGDALSEREIKIIAEPILGAHHAEIRSACLVTGALPAEFFSRSVAQIVATSSKPELLQLILAAPDDGIVKAVEDCIDAKKITVPPSEVRRASVQLSRGWVLTECECSSMGVRVTRSDTPSHALARTKRMILAIYDSDNDKEQLLWRLQDTPGVTLGEKVENYINREDPSQLLEQLVLADVQKVRKALEHLHAPSLLLPVGATQRRVFKEKLLWKLGFPRQRYESVLSTFFDRLRKFRGVSQEGVGGPTWQEEVRSAGVNCFVSLEEVLDLSLSFVAWVMLSDPIVSEHSFGLSAARSLMASELSGVITTDKGPIQYSSDKKNVLFPLIHGFHALRKRCEQILKEDGKTMSKPKLALPSFLTRTSLQLFPYLHRIFLLDATKEEVNRLFELLSTATARLEQAKAMSVRNRIDHDSDDFPSAEEIQRCCELLEGTVRDLEVQGLVPVLFSFVSREADSFGRERILFENYESRRITVLPSPSLDTILTLPSTRDPQILLTSLHIPETAEILRFSWDEESDFSAIQLKYSRQETTSTSTEPSS